MTFGESKMQKQSLCRRFLYDFRHHVEIKSASRSTQNLFKNAALRAPTLTTLFCSTSCFSCNRKKLTLSIPGRFRVDFGSISGRFGVEVGSSSGRCCRFKEDYITCFLCASYVLCFLSCRAQWGNYWSSQYRRGLFICISLLYAKRVLFVRATGRDVILPMLMIHFEASQREVSIIHVILVVERSEIIHGRRRFRRGLFIITCYYIYKACILGPREWTWYSLADYDDTFDLVMIIKMM